MKIFQEGLYSKIGTFIFNHFIRLLFFIVGFIFGCLHKTFPGFAKFMWENVIKALMWQ